MDRQRSCRRYFLLCGATVVLLCIGQILVSKALIFSSCALFLLTTIFAAVNDFSMPILLFYLPWSTVLKLVPGGKSFYTIALLLVCMIVLLKHKLRFNGLCLVSALMIFSLTMTAKMINGEGISFAYLMFLFMLVMFPNVLAERRNFPEMLWFFSLGIVLAALTAKGLSGIDTIGRYITVHSGEGLLRYSGFYGDANFYSAHISAAISGLLLMILKETRLSRCFLCGAMILLLFYCGCLAASKAFFLTIGLVFLLWILLVFREKSLLFRIGTVLLCIGAGGIIIAFGWLDTLFLRLQRISSISNLTTGRTELWLDYLDAFLTEPKLFFLGVGLSESKLHGLSAHNTVLQILYQLGVVGLLPLMAWQFSYLKTALPRGWTKQFRSVLLLGIGCFLPWLALDLLFFDEFFLLPLFWAAGCQYAVKGGDVYGNDA